MWCLLKTSHRSWYLGEQKIDLGVQAMQKQRRELTVILTRELVKNYSFSPIWAFPVIVSPVRFFQSSLSLCVCVCAYERDKFLFL